jgi:hypothetical protein
MRRGVRPSASIDTFRCANLADPRRAEAELAAKGFSVRRPTATPSGTGFDLADDIVRILHHIYSRVFGRPAATRVDRYSKGFNAYYAGGCRQTALREISHYVTTRFSVDDPGLNEFTFDVFEVEFFGSYRDLCGFEKGYPELLYDRKKDLAQSVGGSLFRRGDVDALRVPSVRHRQNGKRMPNVVGYKPHPLTPVAVCGTVSYRPQIDRLGRRRPAATTYKARTTP